MLKDVYYTVPMQTEKYSSLDKTQIKKIASSAGALSLLTLLRSKSAQNCI